MVTRSGGAACSGDFGLPGLRDPLSELRDAKCISIRVLEPCHPRTVGRIPDAHPVLLHARITLEMDAFGLEVLRYNKNIRDLPTQDRVLRRCEFLDGGNSQHRPATIEHESKAILTDQLQAENVTVERLGSVRIARSDESDEFLRFQCPLWLNRNCFVKCTNVTTSEERKCQKKK